MTTDRPLTAVCAECGETFRPTPDHPATVVGGRGAFCPDCA